jgi:hypothetical protein
VSTSADVNNISDRDDVLPGLERAIDNDLTWLLCLGISKVLSMTSSY